MSTGDTSGSSSAKRVLDLYDRIDEVLKEMRIPEVQRDEIQKNLMEAISADLLVRLGNRLSDEDREKLTAVHQVGQAETDLSAVTTFFKSHFSQDDLVEELSQATESVLTDFVLKIAK